MKAHVKIKSLHPDFEMPRQAYPGDFGFDIRYCGDEEIMLHRGKRALIPCGFAMELPEGYEAQVRPRSGLALKQGITVLNSPGTIDAGYRNEVKVVLYNTDIVDYKICPGERIAQLVISRVPEVTLELVEELSDTVRGLGGFGSSGKK